MAGIYIHIPFCSKKCGYCDFYSIVDHNKIKNFVNSLILEFKLRKNELLHEKINTIYFGGGTPSLLDIDDFNKIFQCLSEICDISSVVEITVEVNPDDLNLMYLKQLKTVGFNRISIGIQSFNDELLHFMNRRHNAQQAQNAVNLVKKSGFNNISIDLIYGLPGMSLTVWRNTLKTAVSLDVQHISSYHLTFEKGTSFFKKLKNGELKEIDDEESFIQFNELRNTLKNNGFVDYEISNFSMPGKESIHNSSYWTGNSYFGFGPSAHSFFNNRRQWNVSNLNLYITSINSGLTYFDYEDLSEVDVYNELVMLSLRTRKGLNLKLIENKFSEEITIFFNKEMHKHVNISNVSIVNDNLFICDNKKFITDQIISDFFIV